MMAQSIASKYRTAACSTILSAIVTLFSTTGCGPKEGQPCGGQTGATCGDALYCAYPDRSCGLHGEEGVCTRPPYCPKRDPDMDGPYFYDVSCACDGGRYGPSCAANEYGFDLAPNNACQLDKHDFACGKNYICNGDYPVCVLTPGYESCYMDQCALDCSCLIATYKPSWTECTCSPEPSNKVLVVCH